MAGDRLTLHEIGEQFRALEALLEESGGEWTPEVEAWFAEYGALEKAKVDSVASFLRNREAYAAECEARAKIIRAEATVLANKAKAAENAVERFKNRYLLPELRTRGLKELAGSVWKIARQFGSQPAPVMLRETDPAKLPQRFLRYIPPTEGRWEVDEALVRSALQAEDPEALAVASLGERPEHVRIR